MQTIDASAAPIDMKSHYSSLLAAISQHDHSLMRQRVDLLFRDLNEAQFLPQRVRIEVIRLICRLESHCLECGIPEGTVEGISRHASEEILSSPFFLGIQALFSAFCEQVSYCLERYTISGSCELEASIKAYIAEHYRQNIRLQDIAETFHFSSSYFTQVFKKHFGMTLTEYVTQFRVEKSQQLLLEYNLPVEAVAAEVGFNSYSYFCTIFKKLSGMTPKEYRTCMVHAG
ncbi:helix-turn-helix transcriptional regulator [Lawsonibacter sp. LCP25S3_G6]|uniref:helix-turn-helix transcriptional regulator n=1 Tax=unclassified Lawsonibacter TaxID=2617946 RepID=UPI003F9AFC9C